MTRMIRLSIRDESGERIIEANEAATWQTMRGLMGLSPAKSYCVGGITMTADLRAGTPPLVDGACVEPLRSAPAAASTFVLVVTQGRHQGASAKLAHGEGVLGRDHPLLEGDPHVSRQHAVIESRFGEVTVEDLGSANGTLLEGRPLGPGRSRWAVGERLTVGTTELVLTLPGHDAADSAQASTASRRPSDAPTVAPLAEPSPIEHIWPEPQPTSPRSPLRWAAVLAPIPVAVCMVWVMHSFVPLLFLLMTPLILLGGAAEDRRHGRRSARQAAAELEAQRRVVVKAAEESLMLERQYRRRAFPGPSDLVRSGAWPFAALTARGLQVRLGQGDSPSVHSIRSGAHVKPLVLQDAPVVAFVAPGTRVHLQAPDAAVSNIVEWLAAQLVRAGLPAQRLDVVVPSSEAATWAWTSDGRPAVVLHQCADEVETAVQATWQEGKPFRVRVIDVRTAGWETNPAVRRADTADITIGSQPANDATPRWVLGVGHRVSRSPTGHPFTADCPEVTVLDQVLRTARHARPALDQGNHLRPVAAAQLQRTPHDGWTSPTTAIPVGMATEGVYHLDLVTTGPHALVAGTTGSGKSEFLLTYLRGLFAANPPSEVAALLIDYKGGATFGPLLEAPHVVGLVTDLDAGLAERALTGLHAEIKRRERIFNEVGAASYVQYRRTRGSEAHEEPLPRLFIVVDEFKVLADDLPEFVRGLVRLAAVGRSLGLHLILATQRPGGAVTPDIRANVDVRIALRMRERHESTDVIDSPVAATISRQTPGRAFVALGGEPPVEVQMAHTVAPLDEPVHVHPVRPAQGDWRCPGCAQANPPSELPQFVRAATESARDLPRPRPPVLPPLAPVVRCPVGPELESMPLQVSWADLALSTPTMTLTAIKPSELNAQAAALADLPEHQAQAWVTHADAGHLGIAGAPRSGRTTAARRFAEVAQSNAAEVWWAAPAGDHHIAPTAFRTVSDNPDDVARLLTRLDEALRGQPQGPTLLVIDGWETFHDALIRINRGMGPEEFLRLLAAAHRARVGSVITGGRGILSSRLTPLLTTRVVLRHHDPTDYSLAGLRSHQVPAEMPPGRGLVLPQGHQVQFLRPYADDADDDSETEAHAGATPEARATM